MQGSLVKINKRGKKQLRFFIFLKDGTIDYYESKDDKRGSIIIDESCQVEKTENNELIISGENLKGDYLLCQ